MIRNLMIAAQYVHDHVMHFYHLHALDWVDVVSALKADPKATSALAQSISSYSEIVPGLLRRRAEEGEDLRRARSVGHFLQRLLGPPGLQAAPGSQPDGGGALSGSPGLAAGRGEAACHLRRQEPAPQLRRRRRAPAAISVHTAVGQGKGPMHRRRPVATAVNMVGLQTVQNVIKQMKDFVDQVYVPDTLAIASFYKDWGGIGSSGGNFLSFGDHADEELLGHRNAYLIPRGVILDKDISKVHPINLDADNEIQEFVSHSWYKYRAGDDRACTRGRARPSSTTPDPKPPYEHLDVDKKYSWLKSPRWKGKPMEVGPAGSRACSCMPTPATSRPRNWSTTP
jgi:hydrogenase large subunit